MRGILLKMIIPLILGVSIIVFSTSVSSKKDPSGSFGPSPPQIPCYVNPLPPPIEQKCNQQHVSLYLNGDTAYFQGERIQFGDINTTNWTRFYNKSKIGARMRMKDGAKETIHITARRNNSLGSGGLIEVKNGEGSATVQIAGGRGGGKGIIKTSVLKITGGADLAEPFEISRNEVVKPGMVMVIDPTRPGHLRIAETKYNRAVAGIVSGANGLNPGLTMTQAETAFEGTQLVALTGRVFALADSSYSAIAPGDLLTTSDTPGHIMKVMDYKKAQGAIIGKAMTGLGQGTGLVLVLVSLQ